MLARWVDSLSGGSSRDLLDQPGRIAAGIVGYAGRGDAVALDVWRYIPVLRASAGH